MKPVLVLALGNPLAGDDGVGTRVLERIARDAAVCDVADLLEGGTDLFRHADAIRGRECLVLVDAALSTAPAPRLAVRRHPPASAPSRVHAHDLDPVAALELLRQVDPAIAEVDAWWLLVEVPELQLGDGLSPAVEEIVGAAAARLRALILPSDAKV